MTEQCLERVEDVVDRIIEERGRTLSVGLPLGIGKPNHIVNELTQRAVRGELDRLEMFTALSLSTPSPGSSDLQRRLMGPILDRVYGDFPDLDYVKLRAKGELPENMVVKEFYYPPGSLLGSAHAQRNYKSVNFTAAYQDMLHSDLDVIAQLVAPGEKGWDLSCNPDITLELMPRLRSRGADTMFVAQVNRRLPSMGGSAEVAPGTFDVVLDNEALDFEPFGMPSMPPTVREWAVGVRVAAMLRDGGTVQIGIGNQGDSIAWSSILRHEDPNLFAEILDALNPSPSNRELVANEGGIGRFDEGLYASTEMFVEGILHMYRKGVISRAVDDGVHVHAAFFLGSPAFYEGLRNLDETDRQRLAMTSVLFTNLLYGEEEKKRAQRQHARFMNEAMMVTLTGGIVSDGLEDGRVVSGVGGQYEFVAQAHALENARSIIMLPSVREKAGKVTSNIVWNYGHITIPRHLRDLVATEYGIADLRGKTDEDVVKALVEIADSRFQQGLIDQAKSSNKLAKDYELPERARHNNPDRIARVIDRYRDDGVIPRTPFGGTLTDMELDLVDALREVKGLVDDTKSGKLPEIDVGGIKALIDVPDDARPYLERMELAETSSFREQLLRGVVVYGLRASGHL